jgi:glycosyltransferase involved in cell wall biosynthesis
LIEENSWYDELIVVDDGSDDETYQVARQYTPQVIRMPTNQGKSAVLMAGVEHSSCSILLFLDADLGETARLAKPLLTPVQTGECDMTIAVLPETKGGGLGIVKEWARRGIYRHTGVWLRAPLSGQRALRKKEFKETYKGDHGFGFEVGLTVDYLRAGYRIQEVEIPFTHRERGKTLAGFWHRFKQGMAVNQALRAR